MTQKFSKGDRVRVVSTNNVVGFQALSEGSIHVVDIVNQFGDISLEGVKGSGGYDLFFCKDSFSLAPAKKFVIIGPGGRLDDTSVFTTEDVAAKEAAIAFDRFTIAEIVPVADYNVVTNPTLLRKECK